MARKSATLFRRTRSRPRFRNRSRDKVTTRPGCGCVDETSRGEVDRFARNSGGPDCFAAPAMTKWRVVFWLTLRQRADANSGDRYVLRRRLGRRLRRRGASDPRSGEHADGAWTRGGARSDGRARDARGRGRLRNDRPRRGLRRSGLVHRHPRRPCDGACDRADFGGADRRGVDARRPRWPAAGGATLGPHRRSDRRQARQRLFSIVRNLPAGRCSPRA